MASTRLGSFVETRVSSSIDPFWFFRIGRALSRIVLHTSRALPLLVVTSTTLVNMKRSFRGWGLKGNLASADRTRVKLLRLEPSYATAERRSMTQNKALAT